MKYLFLATLMIVKKDLQSTCHRISTDKMTVFAGVLKD